jgi:hypothetical protein
MTELAAARELLRGVAESFTSLRATHRVWRDGEVVKERNQHLAEARRARKSWVHPPFAQGRGDQRSEEARFQVVQRELWVQRPARVRVEHGEYVLVIDGDRWWEKGLRGGPVAGQNESIVKGKLELDHVAFMLDPSYFAGMDGLSVVGTESVGRRAVLRLTAPPADPAAPLFPGIGWGAFGPEFDLWMDAERGILMRTAERFRGRDYQVAELLNVEFDVPMPEEVFTLALPPGQEFRRYRDVSPQRLTLDEAVRRVPFTIFVPENPPAAAGSWDGKFLFEPEGVWLSLAYVDQQQIPQYRLDITERRGALDDEEDLAGYEALEHDGQPMLVRSAQSRDGAWHSVLLSREGTLISIDSMLDLQASIAVAHSLRPLPRS